MIKTKEQILNEFRNNLAKKHELEQAIEDNLFTEQYHEKVMDYFFAPPEVDCPFIFALMELSKLPKEELPSFTGGDLTKSTFKYKK